MKLFDLATVQQDAGKCEGDTCLPYEVRTLVRNDVANIDVNVVDAPLRIELQAWYRRSDGTTEPSPELWMLDPDAVEEFVRDLLAAGEGAMIASTMDPDRGDELDEDLAALEHFASLANEPGD